MLTIRLRRRGRVKRQYYRILIRSSRNIHSGRYIERVGFFDPLKSRRAGQVQRIKMWLKRAKMRLVINQIRGKRIKQIARLNIGKISYGEGVERTFVSNSPIHTYTTYR